MTDIIELLCMIFGFLAEIFGDAFERLFIFFIPERKFSPKLRKALSVVALVISILFLAMLFFGISLLITEGIRCVLGWVFVGIGVLYTIACIVINTITKSKIR